MNRTENRIAEMLRDRKSRSARTALVLLLAAVITGTVAGIFHLPATAKTYQKTALTCAAAPESGEGYADFFVHTHNDDCYDEDGNLVCELPEIETHEHDDSCYTVTRELVCTIPESEGHRHTEECYSPVRGKLICELSTEPVLDEEGNVLEEGHVHTDECYEWHEELICGKTEGEGAHHHSDSCYETIRTLSCDEPEIILHTHEPSCFDEQGKLICGQIEVREHVHGPECFTTYELDDGIPEESAEDESEAERPEAENESAGTVPVPPQAEEVKPEDSNDTDDIDQEAGENTEDGPVFMTEEPQFFFLFPEEEEVDASEEENGTETASAESTVQTEDASADPVEDMEPEDEEAGEPDKEENPAESDGESLEAGDVTDGTDDAGDEPVEPDESNEAGGSGEPEESEESGEPAESDDTDGKGEESAEGETTAKTPDSSESAAESDALGVSMPAQSFTGETGNVTVSVKAPEGAFPEGTTMTVTTVASEEIMDALNSAMTDAMIRNVRAVDITFYDRDGNKIEPLLAIQVKMGPKTDAEASESEENAEASEAAAGTGDDNVSARTTEPAAEVKESVVVHVDDAGNAQVVENATVENDSAEFESDSFSIYVMMDLITEDYLASDGNTYRVTLTYGPEAGIPEGTELLVREILPEAAEDETESEPAEGEYAEYLAKTEEALEKNEKVTFARFFDITLLADGEEIQPKVPVSVKIELQEKPEGDVKAVHFAYATAEAQEKEAVLLSAEAGEADRMENAVSFEAEGFSVYGVIWTTIETNILASDGHNYKITVSFDEDAGIPQDAVLAVREMSGEEYEDYLTRTSIALDAAGFRYARVFDIAILDAAGEHVTPSAPVKVTAELLDAQTGEEAFAVVHFAGETEEPEQMITETLGNTVSFSTESFSAYAIVKGPDALPLGWEKLSTLNDLAELAENGTGLYIGQKDGYYLKNTTAQHSSGNTTGIQKSAKQAWPTDDAAIYYFEPTETANAYYVYCLGESGERLYVYNAGTDSLYLSANDGERTVFTLSVNNTGLFDFHDIEHNRWWNMWSGAGGKIFAAYTKLDDGGRFYLWKDISGDMTKDPYGLDNTSSGLMNWIGGTTGRAMMASATNADALDALPMTVMAKASNNDEKLFVPDNSDISLWTFHWIEENQYYLSTVADGSTKYLKVTPQGLSLVSERDDGCTVQVIPGEGSHAGEISLKAGSTTLTYTGKVETGFKVGGSAGSEWLKLVEISELTADYFMTYSASKISVSDESVTNGSRVIVYTRVWNESKKHYDFYAIDHDGSLIPVYESGDAIQWTGGRLNSLLWSFVEYYWEGTTDPNYYYELYNQYSEKYIAPQVTGGQILSDSTIGINLNGRRNGQYYSEILAWDDPNYAYVGLKADVGTGKVVSCDKDEADDFYFATVQDLPVDDEISTVPTIDHTEYGITMKLTNFNDRSAMSSFLGSDNQYKNGNTEDGLLSTNLGSDGYPVSKGNNSLAAWFAGAQEVNHLFIDSTYRATGYFEYDSTQNFAHYDSAEKEFVVYKEIGTTDSSKGKFYTHGQFFPFNDLKAGVFSTQKNTTDALGRNLSNDDPRKYEQLYHIQNPSSPDYYMGVELNATFTQTPNGLDDWGHDIIYEFTGDDDFWLYVDGELIIDLGGIHDALAGTVNYRTGEVTVNGKHTTLKDLFYKNYIGRGHTAAEADAYIAEHFTQNEAGQYIFKDYTTHTMKIFYLERGAGASNLHMRFNLASIKPGTVELSKKLEGVDSTESVLAEFPYQIYYKTEAGRDTEFRLTNSVAHDPDRMTDYVLYKGYSTPVTYMTEFQVGGVSYQDVFLLKPDETAEISFPEGMTEYRIVECGVDTAVYSSVKVNDQEIEGKAVDGANGRKDYGIGFDTADNRATVNYKNAVKPDALCNLSFTKKLFAEDGTTEITTDQTPFSFRLYLATEFEPILDNASANMHTYHVKDSNGNYCRWDADAQRFVSLNKTDYDQMDEVEKKAATFNTSSNGAISKIPVGYTVEVRHLLAGTQFKLVERPTEIPDGYSFQKYVYNSTEYSNAGTGVSDTIQANVTPHVEVRNLKGWGIRLNKLWTDADYMTDREATFFAVYTQDSSEQLSLVEGSVRRLVYGAKPQTLYWYYPKLPVSGTALQDYLVREVKLTNPVIDNDGIVTGYDAIEAVENGSTVTLSGTQKGESAAGSFDYTVLYGESEIQEDSNVRVDTVTNSRPGIVLKKSDWAGQKLPGATFTFQTGEDTIGTFTSDADGLITVAFLSDNKEYTLTETRAPQEYRGIEAPVTIRQTSDGTLTVSGLDPEYYVLEQGEGKTPTLTIKNRPYSFRAVKVDGDNTPSTPMQGVVFALHREITVDNVTSIDLNPMPGYEKLETDENGVIPLINAKLPANTYELREKSTLDGYQLLPAHTQFTVGPTGEVTLKSHPDGVSLETVIHDEEGGDGSAEYILTIENSRRKLVKFVKVDIGNTDRLLQGAEFDLYETVNGARKPQALYTGLTSGTDGVLTYRAGETAEPVTTFALPIGVYHLIETKAPDGYNLKTEPVIVTVTAQNAPNGVSYDEKTTISADSSGRSYDESTKTYTLLISNNPGVELPETGGIGTMVFYLVGGVLAASALVLLITKKRMGRD